MRRNDDATMKTMTTAITRRRACAIGLGAVAVGLARTGTAFAQDSGPSLDALAQAKGLRFGSAIGTPHLQSPGYLDAVRAECGVLVSENEHKWYTLHNRPDGYDFARPDALTAWAAAEGLDYRGHTLLWNRDQYSPRWLLEHDFGAEPRAAAEAMLIGHIDTVCARYPQIRSWDVVNETVDERTGEFRDTVFARMIGPEAVDVAFHAARAAAPGAQLVYNDFMSWEPGDAAHRDGVLRHLEAWLARGVPIDALGVQGHIGANAGFDGAASYVRSRETEWRRFMDEATGMGLDILITELDVSDRGLPGDSAARDRAVADYTRLYLDLMLSYPQTRAVLTWGMADRFSWLQGFAPRQDGLPSRPLPYDDEFRPKPMREAIAAAFRAAPPRA